MIALALLSVLPWAAPTVPVGESTSIDSSITIDDELRRARNEYAYGNYEDAAAHFHALLYPMRLSTDAQVVECRKFLGLSYHLLDRPKLVEEEFAKLLYVDPDYELDAFAVAPPIIELFESVRRKLQSELNAIRSRKNEARLAAPPAAILRVVERTTVQRSQFLTLMPFGLGQFQNGDGGWGTFFAISEAALLAANITCYLAALDMQYFTAGQRRTVQTLATLQYSSLALFGSLWGIGVVHARLRFIPAFSEPDRAHEELKKSSAALPFWGGNLTGNF